MTAFDSSFLNTAPPEGLYAVDIGAPSQTKGDFGHLEVFADIDSDKYTDLITVTNEGREIQIYVFDPLGKTFVAWRSFPVQGCSAIRNIVVGRSRTNLRLFVTCDSGTSTVVTLVDRITIKGVVEDEYDF